MECCVLLDGPSERNRTTEGKIALEEHFRWTQQQLLGLLHVFRLARRAGTSTVFFELRQWGE